MSINGDVVNLPKAQPGISQTSNNNFCKEASPVLDSTKALIFNSAIIRPPRNNNVESSAQNALTPRIALIRKGGKMEFW